MHVFVLDENKQPLDPCHPSKARKLLKTGRARIFRKYPFTIILQDKTVEECSVTKCQLKLDPGSRTTGIAILKNNQIIWGAELTHRGQQIKDALLSRRQLRRSRRARKTRYRKPRFLNRKRPDGWLAPSLMSRVHNILTWVKKLIKFLPIGSISQELVRFDLQKMENAEIAGVEYQQGELHGYEVREYLLEKWGRKCAYCGVDNTPLEIEHIVPKSKGGSNRISNLTLACCSCNKKKGNQDLATFLAKKPDLVKSILAKTKKPLKDAAAVNSTRWKLYSYLKEFGLPVEVGSGGLTKFNRKQNNLPKTHWLDASCVGKSTLSNLKVKVKNPLLITATGHGNRKMCGTDKYGFPIRYRSRSKYVKGFQTGDIAKAIVTKGKKQGKYVGRIAVRSSGSFNIKTKESLIQGINHKYCKTVHKKDGYQYAI